MATDHPEEEAMPIYEHHRSGCDERFEVTCRLEEREQFAVCPSCRSATVEPGARVVVPEVPAGEEKTNWGQILSVVATVLTSALTIILVVQRL